MKFIATFAALAGTIMTTACGVPLSVNRLYTDRDLASDVQLEGTWTDDNAEEIWAVRKNGDGYVATQLGKNEPGEFSIHLVAIGLCRFLDVAPGKTPDLAIDGHFFLKLSMEGDQLVLQAFDSGWLKRKAAQAGLGAVETADKQFLLTAPTSQLQSFVARFANEAAAFDTDLGRLHRVR